jgi:hypothetical protein
MHVGMGFGNEKDRMALRGGGMGMTEHWQNMEWLCGEGRNGNGRDGRMRKTVRGRGNKNGRTWNGSCRYPETGVPLATI